MCDIFNCSKFDNTAGFVKTIHGVLELWRSKMCNIPRWHGYRLHLPLIKITLLQATVIQALVPTQLCGNTKGTVMRRVIILRMLALLAPEVLKHQLT